jgi:hypothetical protein
MAVEQSIPAASGGQDGVIDMLLLLLLLLLLLFVCRRQRALRRPPERVRHLKKMETVHIPELGTEQLNCAEQQIREVNRLPRRRPGTMQKSSKKLTGSGRDPKTARGQTAEPHEPVDQRGTKAKRRPGKSSHRMAEDGIW